MKARSITRVLQPDYLSQPKLVHEQIAIFIVGSLFWIEARLRGEAFSADIFGHFALMFPAELWAFLMMASATFVWAGLQNPPRRWMVAVGAGFQVLHFLSLGYSALVTGGEMVIGLWCTIFFAPAFVRVFWEAVQRDPR